VFGAGAVGGYFGGRLAMAGHDVTFIARGAHLDAIRRSGLQVASTRGDFVVHPATATDEPSAVGVSDIVLLGVKAGAVSDVAPAIRSLIGPGTVVVPLQNGVEAASDLVGVLGPEPVIGGLCRIVSALTGPGRITHAGIEPTIVMGELDGSTSGRVARVRDILEQAGVAVQVPDDIHVALWEKFLLIAPWGGLGGLTRVPLDVLCHTPETHRLLGLAMAEVAAVAAAHGVQLAADVVDRTVTFLAGLSPGATASMQRDIMEGRPSELDAQIGSIVRLGREKATDTPVNTFIYECLLPGERIARGGD
jgi:2-dehydropantoate 2-reductase